MLMIAYACNPEGTGEHWLGWGWAEQAAAFCDVTLVTTPKAEAQIRPAAARLGIRPEFVAVPRLLGPLSDLGSVSWLRKLAWSRRVQNLAREWHRKSPFDLAHQTTFHTFRVPFSGAGLGIPGVWGPIAGGEHVPPGFKDMLGKAWREEAMRDTVNRAWLKVPSVRKSLEQASCLLVSNRITLEFLPETVHGKCQIVAPNALRPQDVLAGQEPLPVRPSRPPGALELLYVGNCVARRAMPLVMQAMKEPGLEKARLKVVGAGPALDDWRRLAVEWQLQDRVEFTGNVPHSALKGYYQSADALVFPALRDSGGSALLEAMAQGLPVICLDWGGPAEMLDDRSGLRISITPPETTAKRFAAGLLRLSSDPALGRRLAEAGRERALTHFSWDAKREMLKKIYGGLSRSSSPE